MWDQVLITARRQKYLVLTLKVEMGNYEINPHQRQDYSSIIIILEMLQIKN